MRRLKGSSRPIYPATQRLALLSALECVDYVVVLDDDTPHQLLAEIRPDVLVKGGTYEPHEVVGRDVAESSGGRIWVTLDFQGISTSSVVQSIVANPLARDQVVATRKR